MNSQNPAVSRSHLLKRIVTFEKKIQFLHNEGQVSLCLT